MAALSQSCAFTQSTILSWHLPACCFLRISAGSLARWCVTTKVDVVALRLSHASWWGKKNHKACLDTHGQINVRLTQQRLVRSTWWIKNNRINPLSWNIWHLFSDWGKKNVACMATGTNYWHILQAGLIHSQSQYLLTLQIRMRIRVHSHLHAHYLLRCFLWGISEDGLSRLCFFKAIGIIWVNTQANNGIKTFLKHVWPPVTPLYHWLFVS